MIYNLCQCQLISVQFGSRLSLTRRRHQFRCYEDLVVHRVSTLQPCYNSRIGSTVHQLPSAHHDMPLSTTYNEIVHISVAAIGSNMNFELSESCVIFHLNVHSFLPVCSVSVFAYINSYCFVPDTDPVCSCQYRARSRLFVEFSLRSGVFMPNCALRLTLPIATCCAYDIHERWMVNM